MGKIIQIVALLIMFTGYISAQDLTIDQAVDSAAISNQAVKQAIYDYKAAGGTVTKINGQFDHQFNAGIIYDNDITLPGFNLIEKIAGNGKIILCCSGNMFREISTNERGL